MALQPPPRLAGTPARDRRRQGQGEDVSNFDPDQIESARKTFAGPVTFLKSAPTLQFIPDAIVPEVAFAGRSNVGKSSLLNALTGRNGLARTSNTPGRTQELNFFDVGEPLRFRLVDMPGYGFAKAPKDVVKKWRFLVNDYLRGRDVLKRTLVLIDSRHGIKDVDREIFDMLDGAAVSYRIVLTKADKIKVAELEEVTQRTIEEVRKRPAAHPDILVTSSEKNDGIAELRAAVIEAISV
ncbi:MAG: YihA family ribosome biogenesis GTP-binding protein [Alphaproteobacteria bacterium HGW-Alphaproteobacteria-16]|nr:MAG: YihA family ribosome biogenesis GTP-binding protein [Alphaproteobacteria bacterium HGW-Alphaproteobacteria-16]